MPPCHAPHPTKIVTHLHLLQPVLRPDHAQHVLLATLLHLARQQQLVEDEVGLLEVEDDVQLADVAVVLVHLLDVAVHDFQRQEFVVGGVGGGDEEEGGVAAVDDLRFCVGEREELEDDELEVVGRRSWVREGLGGSVVGDRCLIV